ncbi:putative reverse transcriptase domain-containing protein [Tanacetum coccineum]|uniref:Reverse transcriptase domain-containing protein n=1 Tax=Tanacetum coccineum TaxID=301880 RepID=A0ABQ4ZXI7_9ASTR
MLVENLPTNYSSARPLLKSHVPRLNKAQGPRGNRPNQVAANNRGIEPSELGFRYEIEIASGHLVEIDKDFHLSGEIEFRIDLIPRALPPIAKSPYRLAPSKLEELKCYEIRLAVRSRRMHLTLKENCVMHLLLSSPMGTKDFVVYCDASGLGLGCVLMQREGKDKERRKGKSRKEYKEERVERRKGRAKDRGREDSLEGKGKS